MVKKGLIILELCNQLRLTPANAKYAQGRDFTISIGTPQDPQLNTDIKQAIRPNLEVLVQVLREKNLKLLETLLVLSTQYVSNRNLLTVQTRSNCREDK